MNLVTTISRKGDALEALTLEQLFKRAEMFGKVRIYSSDSKPPPDCYACKIKFNSIPGTSVEASSEFNRPLADALIEAIIRAEKIVEKYA